MTINFNLILTDAPPAALREVIARDLTAFNVSVLGPTEARPLAIMITAPDGAMIGGLIGRTSFRWLFVELIFVPESLRGKGVGRDLLQKAEAEAKTRGCLGVWLETFSAVAHRFYEKNGYRTFGQLPDYPPGNTRYFLSKDI